jgi:tetratricopeptide (TPR) repeat protein
MSSAEPYRPADEEQVLERLSFKATDPTTREIRTLRNNLLKEPRNLKLAVQLAGRYIERGRSEGDPRFLGQAQAVLAPWWNEPTPPPAALLLRATIRQNAHEFDQALSDLDQVLTAQPSNAQAWLTKASILQVQARYDEARRACQPLTRLAARHVFVVCLSDIAGLTGQAAKSRELLYGFLDSPTISGRERIWISTVLAEIAARTGDAQQADRYFGEGMKAGVKDQYLLGAYADFLLDHNRHREVITLLQRETRADGLLLRLTLAEQALGLAFFKDHVETLAARFAANRARGTNVHGREEARFTLTLLRDPQQALPLAQANWMVQREPADARILLESALAAENRRAAQPVLDWLSTNHVEDLRLQQLAQQLQRGAQ